MHATLQEYRDWSGDQSAVLTTLQLGSASRLVDRAIRGAVYDTDGQGQPTSPAVVAALRDATCAVLAYRHPPAAPGGQAAQLAPLVGVVKSATIGPASYTLVDPAGPVLDADTTMPREASDILLAAGLAGGPVWVVG